MPSRQKQPDDPASGEATYQWISWVLGSGVLLTTMRAFRLGSTLGQSSNTGQPVPSGQPPSTALGIVVVFVLLAMAAAGMILMPVMAVKMAPGLFQFLRGAPEYRKLWYRLQFNAWMLTFGFGAVGFIALRTLFNKSTENSALFIALPAIIAGMGFYIFMMAFMPTIFFDENVLGKKAKEFLGCQKSASVPLCCFLGSAGLIVLSLAILAVPIFALPPG